MKKQPPKPCPLCKSTDVIAFQCGWSTVLCRTCGLKLSKAWGLRELINFWNEREKD